MKKLIERMIQSWGIALTVHHQGIHTQTRGIFVPTTSRSWQNMQHVFTPLGETPRGQYNYIGAMSPAAEAGDTLTVGEKSYLIRRSEIICDRSGPLYRWALCVENGGRDQWGDPV